MSLDAYLARAALADKAASFTDYFKEGQEIVTTLQDRYRQNQARGMLTGTPEDYTLANLSNIAAKDPELAKTMMAIRSADSTARYYDAGGRSAQLTPAQKATQDLAKIKVNKASELKAIGGAGMQEYMQGRFGHIMESTGGWWGDDVSILKGVDLSTKAKVRKFIATNKKKLFPEGVPKTTALGKEIKAALDAYDTAVEAGANTMLYQPEVAEGTTSTPSSPLRNTLPSSIKGFNAGDLAPLVGEAAQEVATDDPIDNMAKVLRALQEENANDPKALTEKEQALYAQIKMNIDKKFGINTPEAREALQDVNALFRSIASQPTVR